MHKQIRQGAEAFFLPGSREKGIVLVHGFTGAPPEMRLLGEFLHERGDFTVLGVRLPGHGTCLEELESTVWIDWYGAVEDGVMLLRKSCAHVYIAGLSMGGLLAMKAAAELPVEKAAFLAAPIFLRDRRVPFIRLLRYFIKRIKKRRRTYDVPEQYLQGYDEIPTRPIPSLLSLISLCKKEYLGKIKIPILIIQSERDHTVNPKSALYIYRRLKKVSPKNKEIFWLGDSGHILTLDMARERVFARCLSFFEG